jgi:hypothetical protein
MFFQEEKMSSSSRKLEKLDLVGAFEQGWIQYKSNFVKIIPFGLLSTVPSVLFFFNIPTGIVAAVLFQGILLVLLANAVFCAANGTRSDIYSTSRLFGFFKNGVVLSIFLLPLLAVSFVFFIVPSVMVFSLFMFSFFIVASRDKFAVDALMDSLRAGFGYRLHLFLFSLIFFSAVIIAGIFSSVIPFMFVPVNGLMFPYFFTVIHEIYEQLEKK